MSSRIKEFLTNTSKKPDEIDPYDCRVYVPFNRVTETFIMLDGTERTFTYDDGVVNKNLVSIDENGLYKITEASQHRSSEPVIRATFTKLGEVDRESVPVIERDSLEEMIAFVDVHRTASGWWDFQSDIHIVPRDEFAVQEDDERGKIRKR